MPKTPILAFSLLLLLNGSVEVSTKLKPIAIGTVAVVIGQVKKALVSGETVELLENDKIFEGEEIQTSDKAYAKVLMLDDTVIGLGQSTRFKFTQYKYRSKKQRKSIYTLKRGKMRSLFTIKAKPGDIKIKTPDTVMEVKGTEILANVTSDGKTHIALISGNLDINISALGLKQKRFNLKTAHVFSSKQVESAKSLASVSRMDTKLFTQLESNPEGLLPDNNRSSIRKGRLSISKSGVSHRRSNKRLNPSTVKLKVEQIIQRYQKSAAHKGLEVDKIKDKSSKMIKGYGSTGANNGSNNGNNGCTMGMGMGMCP